MSFFFFISLLAVLFNSVIISKYLLSSEYNNIFSYIMNITMNSKDVITDNYDIITNSDNIIKDNYNIMKYTYNSDIIYNNIFKYLNYFNIFSLLLMLYSSFIIITKKNKMKFNIIYFILFPLYWILHYIASIRSIKGLLSTPFYWAKTEHGIRRRKK